MIKKEELTLHHREFEESWEVNIGKEKYILNEKQIEILKKADLEGHRGLVWFDKFAISIPHIQSVYRISRKVKSEIESKFKAILNAKGKTIGYKI